MKNRGWKVKTLLTDERELNDLIEAYKSGMSWKEMERIFWISHGTCYNALEEAGKREFQTEQIVNLTRMLQN